MKEIKIERYKPKITKNQFFLRFTAAEIKKEKNMIKAKNNLVELIEQLDSKKDYLVIQRGEFGLIPHEYYPTIKGKHDITGKGRTFAARKFLKHGPTVDLEKVTDLTLMNYVRQEKGLHVAFRERAFNLIAENKRYYLAGYTFRPIIDGKTGELIIGENAEKRHIPLVECVQAALLQYYWRHSTAKVHVEPIEFHNYRNITGRYHRIKREGLRATVVLPSRTESKPRYKVDLDYVPLIDNDFSQVLAFSIATHHECKIPAYDRGYTFEINKQSQKRMYFDAHAIFAYFALATHYIEEARKKNIKYHPNKPNDFRTQRRNSPFALPTEDQIHYNLKLMNNVLIEGVNEKGKTQLYPLNKAEQEILTWGRVIKRGHDATFFATKPLWKYDLSGFIR